MASPGNRHCANCIATLSFTMLFHNAVHVLSEMPTVRFKTHAAATRTDSKPARNPSATHARTDWQRENTMTQAKSTGRADAKNKTIKIPYKSLLRCINTADHYKADRWTSRDDDAGNNRNKYKQLRHQDDGLRRNSPKTSNIAPTGHWISMSLIFFRNYITNTDQ